MTPRDRIDGDEADIVPVALIPGARVSETDEQPHRVAAPRYLTTIVVLLFINVVATAILPDLLDINYGVVQGLLMFLAIVVTFMTLSKWVFSPQGGST